MTRLLRWLLVVAPPIEWIVIGLLGYASIAAVCGGFSWYYQIPFLPQHHLVLFVCVTMMAAAGGLYRGFAFHPGLQPEYRRWLLRSPWTPSDPLPLGPAQLVGQDLIWLTALQLLAAIHAVGLLQAAELGTAGTEPIDQFLSRTLQDRYFVLIPLIAFLLAYEFAMAVLCWATGVIDIALLLFAGLLLVLHPLPNHSLGLTLLIALYAVSRRGLRESLTQLWHDSLINSPGLDDTQRIAAADVACLGWPYRGLGPTPQITPLDLALERTFINPGLAMQGRWASWPYAIRSLSLTVLIGWAIAMFPLPRFLLAVADARDSRPPPDDVLWLCYFVVVYMACAVRIGIYCRPCLPPISLWGRLGTGRLVLPGYDKVLLAPLAILVAGHLCHQVVIHTQLPLLAGIALATAFILGLSLNLGPSLLNWQLTGDHRLNPSAFRPSPPKRTE